ncbi:MAG: DNA translocase FtsK [Candidatus Omnitrophica bacterium]|nr:DNA translocase FtsK [Candidatus Omnitrophota bacterium]
MNKQRINEIFGLAFLAVAILVLISLVSYNPDDVRFLSSASQRQVDNFAGIVGAYIAAGLFFTLGWGAYIIPFLCFTWAANKFLGREPQKMYLKISGTIVLFLASSILLSMIFGSTNVMKVKSGGVIGLFLSDSLIRYFGRVGTYVLAVMLVIMSALLATEFLIIPFIILSYSKIKTYFTGWRSPTLHRKKPKINIAQKIPVKKQAQTESYKRLQQPKAEPKIIIPEQPKPARPIIKPHIPPPQSAKPKQEPVKVMAYKEGEYKLPPMDLLDDAPQIEEKKIKGDLAVSSKILEETLQDFGIDVKVTQVEQGPAITRYELEPAPGVKVTRITSLSDDIALAMKAHSVRIVAPIPGKARVGVEVPNVVTSLVYLKEILQSSNFINSKSKLNLALGKDIAGNPVICNLGNMPHLLIAGTTGAGKTVCVNCIVLSMVFNAAPDELKFILIDPKMVELAMFNKLPHLLSPVLTDPKKVSMALNWLVQEMENRYKLLAKVGARNIELYNQKASKEKFSAEGEEKIPDKLPYIVVVIDELADLMAVASQDIESAITRLAQLSRAVGIHMILATQRPSVDVITGVIKANFPARISFKVASKVDSRTVLDMNGADKLLGRGDMLFIEPGAAKPVRAQASLVSDKEIERVVNFVSSQMPTQYEDRLLNAQDSKKSYAADEDDELYDEAVTMVLESGLASVSLLQRRMKLGHMRAARLIDAMEEKGIVGPYQGSKPRDILVDREAYLRESIQNKKSE